MPRGRPKGSKNKVKELLVEDSPVVYIDNYRGNETITEELDWYDVLCIVREAMRAEHTRFDWLNFYKEYIGLDNYGDRKKLIYKYAPSVNCQ